MPQTTKRPLTKEERLIALILWVVYLGLFALALVLVYFLFVWWTHPEWL